MGTLLTEQILLDLGFQKGDNIHVNNHFYFFLFPTSKRMLSIGLEGRICCLHDIYNGLKDQKIIQVPQFPNTLGLLQNLYLALTGEELTYKTETANDISGNN